MPGKLRPESGGHGILVTIRKDLASKRRSRRQFESPKLEAGGPDVDQRSSRPTVRAGSEAVGQLPPEPAACGKAGVDWDSDTGESPA